MVNLFYRFITLFAKYLGPWFFRASARFVSFGYFIFFPGRVAVGVRFFSALFPEKGRAHHLLCTWRQFHSFTDVFLDRFLLELSGDMSYTSEGWDRLEETAAAGNGGIIVMSHMGNWDVAAHLLRMRGMNLLLYLGARQKEQLEKMQKKSLAESGLAVVTVDREGGSPFDILEGLGFLRKGGLISLAGDRLWTSDQRQVVVRFAGRRAVIPEAPHALALLSGAPLFYLFALRTGERRYHIAAHGPYRVIAASRGERNPAIRESAQRYADLLDTMARKHPAQWYHFEEFLREEKTTTS
jgi:lauroyl/myristoyl acyltransferase